MVQALRDAQAAMKATFDTAEAAMIPVTFGNDAVARESVQAGVALVDLSHWGRIRVSDSDRLRFLHNQSTNDFQQLQPGQGCQTVFVTSTARTLDLVTAYVAEDEVLLLTSPQQQQTLIDWMDRYIFFADKVKLTNLTDATVAFSLMGPESDALLQKLGAEVVVGQPLYHHQLLTVGGVETRVAVGSGLAIAGYILITPVEQAAALWQTLVEAGAVPTGDRVWQQLRVEQGRPIPGSELTEEVNPLEAGLWHTISFEKGCYIGQETIARLNTYKGVKQQLWGLKLGAIAPAGTPVLLNGEKVGVLTSVVETPEGLRGLAYIRTKAGGASLTVQVGETAAEVVDLPFLSRGYLAQPDTASA